MNKASKLTFLICRIIVVGMVLVLTACGGSSSDDSVSSYMKSLPQWSEFSPTESAKEEQTADPVAEGPVTLSVTQYSDSGDPTVNNVTYACQSQPYTLTSNPEKIVMFSPDLELLWPGALIQGKSHRDGLGSLLGLPIAERTAIEVSIPGLNNNDNFRLVDQPSQAKVGQAVGSMIGAATSSGLSTPSSITFKMETYHSEQEAALKMGLSGHYLGFEASATGEINNNASKTTVTAQFYQKMFEVVVAPPQTPDAFFSNEFTTAKLQEQINLGKIGPDNLPVYVSNVVYGRMMMFSMTSTASEKDIRATMQAAYDNIGSGGKISLNAKQKSVLQNSEIKVTSLGGDAKATIAMIKSGNWADYFTDSAALSSAAPMSYTFRNLSDGSIATVSETTEYNIKTCMAQPATPGTFTFLDVQPLGLPISAPAKPLIADINNDGRDDIIWNSLTTNSNETIVGLSNGDGTFTMLTDRIHTHTAVPSDVEAGVTWNQFAVQTGDFNNDGRADLAWSKSYGSKNITYVALSNPNDTGNTFSGFTEMPVIVRPETGWGTASQGYEFKVGNIDNKNGDDLIWNLRRSDGNRTYVSLSNGDGTFEITKGSGEDYSTAADGKVTGWNGNEVFQVADANGDGRDDLIWYTQGVDIRHVYIGLSVSDTIGKHFEFKNRLDSKGGGWTDYITAIGDIDAKNGVDLVWFNNKDTSMYQDLATGTGLFNISAKSAKGLVNIDNSPYQLRMLDVNYDGRDDLLFNSSSNLTDHIIIGLGNSDGTFGFNRVAQDHPASDDWGQYTILTGDFNGDDREDVLYNNADATNNVYVGLAKP